MCRTSYSGVFTSAVFLLGPSSNQYSRGSYASVGRYAASSSRYTRCMPLRRA
jgi:hypothetical protein